MEMTWIGEGEIDGWGEMDPALAGLGRGTRHPQRWGTLAYARTNGGTSEAIWAIRLMRRMFQNRTCPQYYVHKRYASRAKSGWVV